MRAGGGDPDISELVRKTEKMEMKSPTFIHQKMPNGTREAGRLRIATNVWGVIPEANIPIYLYDFRILAEFPPKKGTDQPVMKEITKQTRDDYLLVERKKQCVTVYTYLVDREKTVFPNITKMVYDRAAMLYSIEKLKLEGSDDAGMTFIVTAKELFKKLVLDEDCRAFHVTVKTCAGISSLSTNDLSRCVNSNLDDVDQSLLRFFDTLLMQEVYFNGQQFVSYGPGNCYLLDPSLFGFEDQDTPEIGEGKYIGIGASKGVRVIEGPPKEGMKASVFIDVKKAAFHADNQPLFEKMADICNVGLEMLNQGRLPVEVLNNALKGLRVRCTYGKFRSFVIYRIVRETARTHQIVLTDGRMTVAQYLHSKHGITLLYPNLPLVCERTPRGSNYYPAEILEVCENQRVTQSQQSANQVQKMIRQCALPPHKRYNQTMQMVNALKLQDRGATDDWLRGTGTSVTNANLTLSARILPLPLIEFGSNKRPEIDANRVNWSGSGLQYIKPAKCKAWYAAAFINNEHNLNEESFRRYIRAFENQCTKRGMILGRLLAQEYVLRPDERNLDHHIKNAKRRGAQFIHCITSDRLNFHSRMKYLEVTEQIVTQDLKASTAFNAPGKVQTMENIVNKTNMKLGGINYYVRLLEGNFDKWLSRPDRLIIGLDIAHPPLSALKSYGNEKKLKSLVPSVIGYSANSRKNPMEFVGGYYYAEAQMEELKDNSLSSVIETLLIETSKERQNVPEHIIILRDGVSEGQYKYVINFEVEQIKKACLKVGCKPFITFIIVTKKHNLRLYREIMNAKKRPAEQNITPGVVVDNYVVNPAFTEYYLNSHVALQGTTRCPRYTVVYDTANMSNDESQGLVYALAFDFQIVNSATSRPAPVMIASEMAKRGRANYIALFGDRSQSSESEGAGQAVSFSHANSELSYQGKPLSAVRFNA